MEKILLGFYFRDKDADYVDKHIRWSGEDTLENVFSAVVNIGHPKYNIYLANLYHRGKKIDPSVKLFDLYFINKKLEGLKYKEAEIYYFPTISA